VGYAAGQPEIRALAKEVLDRLEVGPPALFSTLGRTAARGIETMLVARWAREFYGQLLANVASGDTRTADTTRWEPGTWPNEARGVGLSEAPRGALSHWIVIKDGKIDNYQLVVPSTWNASPRDATGQMSAYESSLVGTPVAQTDQPLEILRTIHSFDPCIACAVHVHDPHGRHVHHLDTF
jgi:hydrogenase large subunit